MLGTLSIRPSGCWALRVLGIVNSGFGIFYSGGLVLAPLALKILDFRHSKICKCMVIECSGHQGCPQAGPESTFPTCMPHFTRNH